MKVLINLIEIVVIMIGMFLFLIVAALMSPLILGGLIIEDAIFSSRKTEVRYPKWDR